MSELIPLVLESGNCDPGCPFLKPDILPSSLMAKCSKLNIDLDWYDYWIASCQEDDIN